MPSILNLNPRSIYNKAKNFKQFVKEREIDIVCISESWARAEEPLEDLLQMENYDVISNAHVRKGVGGKPAILVNNKFFRVENPNQSFITIPWGVECVWAILTPKDLTNSSVVKKIVVASFYLKPGSRKKSALFDHIAEVYHLLSSKYVSGLYWIIAGDKNQFRLDGIINLNPDFKQLVDKPTRLNPPRILDVIITNLSKFYKIPSVEQPLEPDIDLTGSPSDHLMVVMSPMTIFDEKRGRQVRNIEFRPMSEDGFRAMESALDTWDWKYLENIQSADEQMKNFQESLFSIFDHCFPTKRRKVFSETEPYFTEKLSKLKRKKLREFTKHRNSIKFRSLHKTYKTELESAKRAFYRKKIRDLRTSNPRSWYQNIKKLMGNEAHEEVIEVEDIKELSDTEQMERIADKFAAVSNLYEPLRRDKIDFPTFSVGDIPVISEHSVLDVLQNLNISKSTRNSDIPAKILKHFAKKICGPLTKIINNCLCQGIWPDIFKMEYVTPVKKVPDPKNIEDLRNISGLLNLNKVMEKIVCNFIVEDMKAKMDPSQFANTKGLSTQHYLIKMLDRVLSVTDNSTKGECVAVLATLVDWKAAFPRQCPTLGVKSFIKNGVRASLIPIIASFFERRYMRVKWRGKLSSVRYLPGSGPQGSTFGVLEYLSQSNDNADNVPLEDRFKFMDDLTILEIIQLASVGLASHNIRSQVPSNIPVHNQFIKSEHLKTTKYLNDINDWTENNLMMLNQKKTKQIIFNFNRDKQFTTEVELKNESLELVNEVKLLGVIISSDLKWHKNTNYLTKKANKKMRMLHLAAKFTKNRDHLKHIYKTFIRSNLEFSSTVWHSSLTLADRQDLERIQKAAVKIILGKDYDGYEKSLGVLNMESLEQRRESMALKFVKNGLKNLNFSKLFPLRKAKHEMSFRNSERFHVKITKTRRHKDSAVPFLQRLLNKDTLIKKENLKMLIDHSKKLEKSEMKNSRVNYICNVDVIT